MSAQFVHLRLHSEFSMKDGIVRLKGLIAEASSDNMVALALTDLTNMCGMVKFYKQAQGAGIKPIIGADIWIADDETPEPFLLTLLAKDNLGYKHLTELVSQSYVQGQASGKPVVQLSWLQQKSQGLIGLATGLDSDLAEWLLKGKLDVARQRVQLWQQVLGADNFFLEIQRIERQDEAAFNQALLELAQQAQVPVVATNNVRFLAPEDFEAHEVRVCVGEGYTLDDPRRSRRYTEAQYFKTQQEMVALFADIPSAISNTIEIAKRCNVDIRLGEYFLPDFPVPEGMTIDSYFRFASQQGLEERLEVIFDKGSDDYETLRKPYDERLTIELDVIIQMGFPGYFLIVADFIQWSKDNGVPVGPGRGSGAGSLVAYALKITDLDPLPYDLLFERFLNPERVSMPDFDVDFCMEGRDRVIDYVANRYGREAVSQIITFGTMAAKAVIRDVGRVLGHPYGFVDKLSKLIPPDVGMTLGKAWEAEEEIRQRYEEDEDVRELWDLAKKLEGVTRNAGKHAGGVVIAPSKLTDFAPLYCDEHGEGLVTQFDKDDVEQAGLVKFDFLGLRTLTIIDWALETLNAKRQKKGLEPVDIALIPLDDEKSFKLLMEAETTAVFQLESRGMKELIKRLKPSCFEDIVALVALYRPGPLQSGMVDDFINRKHGIEEINYPHPSLEPVLSTTYGTILYQEQVMQISQVLAKYTLGGADLLRRAMGKKKPEVMAEQRAIFVEGAIGNEVDGQLASDIFDMMEKFAAYGFNKSHSAAYALVSYQTAWLKAHYPAAFMAAVMSSDMDNTDKVVTFVDECYRMGLEIAPPDVNRGQYKFTVDDNNVIIYGIGAIKGVGEGAIQSIVEEREQNGLYRDLFDFCARIDLKKSNKRTLEALIRAGALDGLGPHRAAMMASLSDAIKAAEQAHKNQRQGQFDLFGGPLCAEEGIAQFQDVKQWNDETRLNGEKDTLGLYLTGHPIDRYQTELKSIIRRRLHELAPTGRGESTLIAGFVIAFRVAMTKRGQKIAILTLDDRSARIELTAFADVFEQAQQWLAKDMVIVVEGEVSNDRFTGGLRVSAKRILSMAQARAQYMQYMLLQVNEAHYHGKWLQRLKQIFEDYQVNSDESSGCAVRIHYRAADVEGQLVLGDDWRLNAEDHCLYALQDLLGTEAMSLCYR